jgi:hypothetical protein
MKKQIESGIITYTFSDAACPAIVFDTTKPNDARKAGAVICGFAATLTDAAALSKNNPDGSVRVITEAMRHAAVKARAEFLLNDETAWTQRTERTAAQNPTWLAIATKRGLTYDEYVAERVAADLAELAALS